VSSRLSVCEDVVCTTMAHLLIYQCRSRFTFSHEFQDLPLGQMLNKLDAKDQETLFSKGKIGIRLAK